MLTAVNIIDLKEDLNYRIQQNITFTRGIDSYSPTIKIVFDVCDRNQTNIITEKIHVDGKYALRCETNDGVDPIILNKQCTKLNVSPSHMYDTITLQFQ